MKKQLVLIALLGFVTTAHAVQTKNCPEALDVKIQRVSVLSESGIFKHAQFSFSGREKETFQDHIQEIRADLAKLQTAPKSFNLRLTDKKESVCSYQPAHQDVGAKIYTKGGKNILELDLASAVIYVGVEAIATDSIQLGRQDNRPLNSEYGEIGDEGRSGDFFQTILGFADVKIR